MTNINNGVLDGVRRIGAAVRSLSVTGGISGAPLGIRLIGANASGPPETGTWKAGDIVPDRTGVVWICIAGGTGAAATWVQSGGSSSWPLPLTQGGTGRTTDPLPPWMAADSGWLAWNFDPTIDTSSQNAIPAGNTIWLMRINIREAMSITNVIICLYANGSGLTANECYAGLFNSAGILLGATADQSSNWATGGGGTGQFKVMPLAGGPYAVTPGFVWVAFVWNGTTGPTFLRYGSNNTQQNPGLSAATARGATNGTGTSLANITPSANLLNSLFFVAVN